MLMCNDVWWRGYTLEVGKFQNQHFMKFLPLARSVTFRAAIRNGPQISALRPKPWFTRPSRCLWDYTIFHRFSQYFTVITSERFSEVNMAGVLQMEEYTTCTTMSPDATGLTTLDPLRFPIQDRYMYCMATCSSTFSPHDVLQVYHRDFDLICNEFGYCDPTENVCLTRVPGMCPPQLFEWNDDKKIYETKI